MNWLPPLGLVINKIVEGEKTSGLTHGFLYGLPDLSPINRFCPFLCDQTQRGRKVFLDKPLSLFQGSAILSIEDFGMVRESIERMLDRL